MEPERLTAEIWYETDEESGLKFPHVYGPVALAAVTAVVDLPPEPDGTFRLPDLAAKLPNSS